MEGSKVNIGWLFLGGSVLFSAGWLIPAFPVFIFIGLAPFFAILDHTVESENFWEHAELILIGLVLSFFSALKFDMGSIVTILIHAIVFTLPFIGFAYVHEQLGARTGKFIVIFIWLGLEYLLVKLQWPTKTIFLADSLAAWPTWFRWNSQTGYLGSTAWVLASNWLIYAATLRSGFNWPLLFLALTVMLGPVAYSYSVTAKPVLRQTMIELYQSGTVNEKVYFARGELVARTCAWVSALVLLFAVVKSRTAR